MLAHNKIKIKCCNSIKFSVTLRKHYVFMLKTMTKLGYPYSYGDDLTEEQVSASLKEVKRGFLVASSVYSVWALASAKPAHASDACPNPGPPTDSPGQIAPSPNQLSKSQKGILTAAVSSICGLASETGDFWIGVGCFGLVLIAMRLANR